MNRSMLAEQTAGAHWSSGATTAVTARPAASADEVLMHELLLHKHWISNSWRCSSAGRKLQREVDEPRYPRRTARVRKRGHPAHGPGTCRWPWASGRLSPARRGGEATRFQCADELAEVTGHQERQDMDPSPGKPGQHLLPSMSNFSWRSRSGSRIPWPSRAASGADAWPSRCASPSRAE